MLAMAKAVTNRNTVVAPRKATPMAERIIGTLDMRQILPLGAVG